MPVLPYALAPMLCSYPVPCEGLLPAPAELLPLRPTAAVPVAAVYSFGVVLLELVTGREVGALWRCGHPLAYRWLYRAAALHGLPMVVRWSMAGAAAAAAAPAALRDGDAAAAAAAAGRGGGGGGGEHAACGKEAAVAVSGTAMPAKLQGLLDACLSHEVKARPPIEQVRGSRAAYCMCGG
jgi:hypothetical protein